MNFSNKTELADLLDKHRRLYESNRPEIPDSVYDSLEAIYDQWEDDPEEDQPLIRDWKPGRGKAIRHQTTMPSMNRVYDLDDIIGKLAKRSKCFDDTLFTVEAKYDGIAFSAVYRRGMLYYVATRGNCVFGEDITGITVARGIIPMVLKEEIDIEIRGEFWVDRFDYNTYNRINKKRYSTQQHLASAAMVDATIDVPVRYVVYRCIGKLPTETYTNVSYLDYVSNVLHLNVAKHVVVKGSDVKECVALATEGYIGGTYPCTEEVKFDIPFVGAGVPLDGIVVKFNSIAEQEMLGGTVRKPRWCVAYKFPSEAKETTINAIRYQHTMAGELVPLAEVTPVTIGGRIGTSPSLYNHAIMRQFNYAVGKRVLLESTGGTVFTIKPLPDSPIVTEAPIPSRCPSCGANTEVINDRVYCTKPEACPAAVLKYFERFYGKSGLNVKGLGTKVLEDLIEDSNLKLPEDIYEILNEDNVVDNKLRKGLTEALSVPLDRLLFALCIPGLGVTGVLKLKAVTKDPSLEWINNKEPLKQTSVPLYNWLSNTNIERLRNLKAIGFKAL